MAPPGVMCGVAPHRCRHRRDPASHRAASPRPWASSSWLRRCVSLSLSGVGSWSRLGRRQRCAMGGAGLARSGRVSRLVGGTRLATSWGQKCKEWKAEIYRIEPSGSGNNRRLRCLVACSQSPEYEGGGVGISGSWDAASCKCLRPVNWRWPEPELGEQLPLSRPGTWKLPDCAAKQQCTYPDSVTSVQLQPACSYVQNGTRS